MSTTIEIRITDNETGDNVVRTATSERGDWKWMFHDFLCAVGGAGFILPPEAWDFYSYLESPDFTKSVIDRVVSQPKEELEEKPVKGDDGADVDIHPYGRTEDSRG